MSGTLPAWQPDPITRLRALAAALPGSAMAHRTVDSGYDRVWRVLSDLERSVPVYEADVERVHVVARAGERLDLVVDLADGRHQRMEARLTDGWCLMQSDDTVVALAAHPDGPRTVVAHLEHTRTPDAGGAADVPTGARRSPGEWRDKLLAEIAVIERLARAEPADPAP